jgi:hypothetical protein
MSLLQQNEAAIMWNKTKELKYKKLWYDLLKKVHIGRNKVK